jgi:hypothetical protein
VAWSFLQEQLASLSPKLAAAGIGVWAMYFQVQHQSIVLPYCKKILCPIKFIIIIKTNGFYPL